jgi:predicted CoA-binding protein
MMTMKEMVEDFLAQERVAVVGVSRTKETPASAIYRRLRDTGYQVFPVNPHTEEFEGAPCYPDVKSIPGGVDGAVIVTRPAVTAQVVRDCVEAGVRRVWMHRSFEGGSSVSDEAVRLGEENGLTVIAGGCPMMYAQPVDFAHRCMRWMLGAMGRLPG